MLLARSLPRSQVLCVNEGLRMGKGKIGAQCAHAAVGIADEWKARPGMDLMFRQWQYCGQAKIALRVEVKRDTPGRLAASSSCHTHTHALSGCSAAASHRWPPGVQCLHVPSRCCLSICPWPQNDAELTALESQAALQGLPTYVVHDAGRTQVAAGSRTVLAIGPAPKSKLDKVTGHLKLL